MTVLFSEEVYCFLLVSLAFRFAPQAPCENKGDNNSGNACPERNFVAADGYAELGNKAVNMNKRGKHAKQGCKFCEWFHGGWVLNKITKLFLFCALFENRKKIVILHYENTLSNC